MKIIRFDRGGEYYERYGKIGQYLGPFTKLLQKRDICVQYTMPSMPQQNGVSKRHNRTLMDIVRIMLINSTLHVSL